MQYNTHRQHTQAYSLFRILVLLYDMYLRRFW